MGNGNVVGDRWLIELQNRSHVKCINFQCSGITLIWNFASHVVTSRLIRFKWQTLLHLASRYVVSLYFEISNIFNHCVKHKKCLLIYHLRTNIVSHYPINKRKKLMIEAEWMFLLFLLNFPSLGNCSQHKFLYFGNSMGLSFLLL